MPARTVFGTDDGPAMPGGHRGAKSIHRTPWRVRPADQSIYDELGVNLTYHPDGRVRVSAEARVPRFVSEGGLAA
jgi:hypothetical protein